MKRYLFLFIFIFFFIAEFYGFEESGIASWYGPTFHGKKTADGEIFNTNNYTAAHNTLPFGSIVKVISLDNNKVTVVRITDRGPFAKNRIIDLSNAAADDLDMIKSGTMKVKIILLEKGDNKYYKYSNKKYKLQLGSFTSEEKANDLLEKYKEKIKDIKIKKIILDKTFYRVVAEHLTYSDMQNYRVLMVKENLNNYIVSRN
jgi:rare lipoprotein A